MYVRSNTNLTWSIKIYESYAKERLRYLEDLELWKTASYTKKGNIILEGNEKVLNKVCRKTYENRKKLYSADPKEFWKLGKKKIDIVKN